MGKGLYVGNAVAGSLCGGGEFDGNNGHVVACLALGRTGEGGGEHVFCKRLRVERSQASEIGAKVRGRTEC